jgi:protein involved in polysaccharide export with SLBB domain
MRSAPPLSGAGTDARVNPADAKAPITDAKAGPSDGKPAPQDAKNVKVDGKTDAKANPDDSQPPAAEQVKDATADEVEFQRFVRSATGQSLKLYGYELFAGPGRFESVQAAPVPSDYILGAGDELVVLINGLTEFNERVTIDRDGRIFVPQVGPVSLAGVALKDAEKVLTAQISKTFRNFKVSVTMGRLRSIEVFVVGQARRPGKQLISSVSSLINALFETGGPSANGSLRAIELRRGGKKIATIDMYAFLSKGDNSADMKLLAGDIIFIPPAGPRAALLGTINAPAIYELKPGETVNSILSLSGGLPTLAAPQKAQLERVDANREIARYVEDFALDQKGLGLAIQAGDIITVFQVSPQIANVVTLQGNVASPLRYTYKPGMKVSDLLSDRRLLIPGSYWLQINQGTAANSFSRPEVNLDYATIQRLDPIKLRTKVIAFDLAKAIAQDKTENLDLLSGDIVTVYRPGEDGPETENSITVTGDEIGGTRRLVWRDHFTIKDIAARISELLSETHQLKTAKFKEPGTSLHSSINVNFDYATIHRRDPITLKSTLLAFNLGKALAGDAVEALPLRSRDLITVYHPSEAGLDTENSITMTGEVIGGTRRFVWRPGFTIKDVIPTPQWLIDNYSYWQRPSGKNLRNDINWDYAQVIRRVPATLSTKAVTFNLGKAVMGGSATDNIALEPGDQIALFTTSQLAVPVEKRTRIVTVSGEVKVPGQYQVAPGETMVATIEKAGGLTQQSYLFGLEFKRESIRTTQQENLDRLTNKIESQILSESQARLQNITSKEQSDTVAASLRADQIRIENMRKLRATGRVALQLQSDAPVLPAVLLEDGDVIHVPNVPAFVGVFGAVLNENAILWRPDMTIGDAVAVAGLTTYADESSAFVLRADGTVLQGSTRRRGWGLSGWTASNLMPGDTVVIPEKPDRESTYTAIMRGLKDWTAIFYQFGLGAAAIKTLRN